MDEPYEFKIVFYPFNVMPHLVIFNQKAFVRCLNQHLDLTRADLSSAPDLSWVVPMTRDLVYQEALRLSGGNQSQAARMLGVSRNHYLTHLARIDGRSGAQKGEAAAC
ncbi:hypothetical protein L1D19_21740 [Vibrio natriegens]|uniref:helix-turn-helix domain-containing protein n=1 Tax=Vibrio natriegens TaxID=691 RepID=UPI001EFC6D37|nr:helix-turn-helix domain-containing protein [Vibrio natriegens]MCG9702693.1 hypothetical protein [Vibrio natriegens]